MEMDKSIKVNLRTIGGAEKELFFMLMEINMMENGKKGKWAERAHIIIKMERGLKDNLKKTNKMMGNISIRMTTS